MASRHEWDALELVGRTIAAAEGDPAYPVLAEWYQARRAEFRASDHYAALEARHGPCAPEAERYSQREAEPAHVRVNAALGVLSRVAPTTPAGLAAQLAVHANMGDAESGARLGWPEETILVSMRDAAMRLAQTA